MRRYAPGAFQGKPPQGSGQDRPAEEARGGDDRPVREIFAGEPVILDRLEDGKQPHDCLFVRMHDRAMRRTLRGEALGLVIGGADAVVMSDVECDHGSVPRSFRA